MEPDITKNYHKGNRFSQQAHKKFVSKAASYREQILKIVKNGGGITCEEIEDITGWKHQTVSARISELKRDNRIQVLGKRKTKSGCYAAVYVAGKPKQSELF